MNTTKDENPLHDWVVLFKEPNSKKDYQKKTFEHEQWAIEFAQVESSGQPTKIFRVGYIDKSAGIVNVKTEYQDGEDLELKPIIERCCQITSCVRQEKMLTILIGLPFITEKIQNRIQILRALRDDMARRLCRHLKNNDI